MTSGIVLVVSLLGMMAVTLAGLGERRRELAILRSVGAGRGDIIRLLALEGFLMSVAGCVAGYLLITLLSLAAAPFIQSQFGLRSPLWNSPVEEAMPLGLVTAVGLIASVVPAWRAFRLALADGLTPRI